MLGDLQPDAQANRFLPRDADLHVLPAQISKTTDLFLVCLVDLTSLAVDVHFELDDIVGSRVTNVSGLLSGWVWAGPLEERSHVSRVGCDDHRVWVILWLVVSCGWFEDVALFGWRVVGPHWVSAGSEREGARGRFDGLEERVDGITSFHIN